MRCQHYNHRQNKMKKILSILMIVVVATITASAQIPNAGFESWGAGANAAPDGWIDVGLVLPPSQATVSRSTDKYLGSYAVKVENKVTATTAKGGWLGASFPTATRYTALTGYYKFAPVGGDVAQLQAALNKMGYVNSQNPNSKAVASIYETLSAAATYTPFSYPFNYDSPTVMPDTAVISFFSYGFPFDPMGNSVLLVDGLNYDTFTNVDKAVDIAQDFALYPNPISDGNFDVSFNTMEEDFVTIRIFDMNAKEIISLFSGTMPAGKHNYHYSLPTLSNGNYLFMVSSAQGFRVEKICIQK